MGRALRARAATDERGRMKLDSAVRKRLAAVDGAMEAMPAQASHEEAVRRGH